MPQITLSDATYDKLKLLAEPFVDTPESIISRLVGAEVDRQAKGNGTGNGRSHPAEDVLHLDPDTPISLTHARLLTATIAGKPLHRPKWNALMTTLHVLARKRLGSLDALRRATSASIREGRYEQDGFTYIDDGGFSIQGVDANLAWSHSLKLARVLNTPIHVTFEWRDKDGAAHPGKQGEMQWGSKQE